VWGGPGVGRMCMMEGEGFWGCGGQVVGGCTRFYGIYSHFLCLNIKLQMLLASSYARE
jgi:hypothetical protein